MAETWFRGEAVGGPVSSPGGHIHDFGDGMYLTDRYDIAKMYAETRAPGQVNLQRVVAIQLNTAEMGRVLDLRTDPRWTAYFNGPGGKQALDIIKTGRMNEFYGESFENFLKVNKIYRDQYDAIVGPEYVRGGIQVCIVQNGNQPSSLATNIRAMFKDVTSGPPKLPEQPKMSWQFGELPASVTVPNSKFRQMAGNQNAMAAIGVALESGLMWLGDIGIERNVRRQLETTYAMAIQNILNRGDGVLVIMEMQEWKIPDFNGMRGRMLLSVSVIGGRTQADALDEWRRTPRFLQGADPGWQTFERYGWIPPAG